MNRQMRREAQRDWAREFERKQRGFDPTKPLVFREGYLHERCGGDAERANGFTFNCMKCDRIVPSDECRRKRKGE